MLHYNHFQLPGGDVMYHINILHDKDFDDFFRIFSNAYPQLKPSVKIWEKKFPSMIDENLPVRLYGAFDDKNLLGIFTIHDFSMNFRNVPLKSSGIGSIAIDLLHKKEKVCKFIIEYFLEYCKITGKMFAQLYPFEPGFYFKMGFGYGSQIFAFSPDTKSLKFRGNKSSLRHLTLKDLDDVMSYYNKLQKVKHGLLSRSQNEYTEYLFRPGHIALGYYENNEMKGYMFFRLKQTWENRELHLVEMQYDCSEVLHTFLYFLNSQSDQVDNVFMYTFDQDLYHLLASPRSKNSTLFYPIYHKTADCGVGLMYRCTNIIKALEIVLTKSNMNAIEECKMRISDNFLNKETFVNIDFNDKRVQEIEKSGEYDLDIPIQTFSSLIVGSLKFLSARKLGLIKCSDKEKIQLLNGLFSTERQPECYNIF